MSIKKGQVGWREWSLLAALMSAMIFSQVDRFALSVLLEPIKSDLGLSDTELGLLNGVTFGIFYATLGFPLGWLADRWSRKGTIIGGIAVWSMATAGCGLATSYFQLILARSLVGAGEAGLSPAAYSILHDRFPRRLLGRAISLLQIGSIIGGGIAILAVGTIYSYIVATKESWWWASGLQPWQITFIAVALPGIVFLALFAFIKDGQSTAQRKEAASGSIASAFAARPKIYIYLMLGMSGIALTLYALLSWMPAIMMREFGWTPARIGSIYGTNVLIFGTAGALFGGWLCDKLVARGVSLPHGKIAMASAVLALPCFLAMSLPLTPFALMALAAVTHFVIFMPGGLGPALTQIVAPAGARGQISGLYVMTVNIFGLGIGPVAVGAVSERYFPGPEGLRSSVSLIVCIALMMSILLLHRLCAALANDPEADGAARTTVPDAIGLTSK